MKNKPHFNRYFAAANSYNGFVSFFDKIFSSEDYERIYVIKGGPGTGKSYLMKRLGEHFKALGCNADEVYCSSDPKSLDGLILEYDKRRIGLLDGTSPHCRDAEYPVLIDSIINVADCIDRDRLVPHRDLILSLSKRKKEAYKCAYLYLYIAGKIDKHVLGNYSEHFDIIGAKNKAVSILKQEATNIQGFGKSVMISAFGKDGLYTLPHDFSTQKAVKIGKDPFVYRLFLGAIRDIIEREGIGYTLLRNPLLPYDAEGFIFDSGRQITYTNSDFDIDVTDLINDYEEIEETTKSERILLSKVTSEAQNYFKAASKIHFELEEIYTHAMIFDKSDLIFEKIRNEIENILEI